MHFDISSRTILQVMSGSHAYGTSLPTSDVDIRGVAISPPSTVLGYFYSFEQYIEERRSGHPADRTIFDLRKFFKLTADCNPNMIEMLFVSDEDVLQSTLQGDSLRANRDAFLSKRAKGRFAAYAMGQLARIKTHRSWLLNPPTHQPTREEYGINFQRKLRDDQLGAVNKMIESGQEVDQNVFQLVDAEKRYNTALKHWQQYNQWKANRNEARAALEAKFGYDTKHAMHLVRLLRMCTEILSGKGVVVKRPDAEELLRIRAGDWSYDELVEYADRLNSSMEALTVASSLPDIPDDKKLNALCVDLHLSFWHQTGDVPQL